MHLFSSTKILILKNYIREQKLEQDSNYNMEFSDGVMVSTSI